MKRLKSMKVFESRSGTAPVDEKQLAGKNEQVLIPEIIKRIREGVRSKKFYRDGFDGPVFIGRLNDNTTISNSRQWDDVWPDGDFWKSGNGPSALCFSASGSGYRVLLG